jgi:hypothetical protein
MQCHSEKVVSFKFSILATKINMNGPFIYIHMVIPGSEISIKIQSGQEQFLKQIFSEHGKSIESSFRVYYVPSQ